MPHVIQTFFLYSLFTTALYAESVGWGGSSGDSFQNNGKYIQSSIRVFDATLVNVEEIVLYEGKTLTEEQHREFIELDKAVVEDKVVVRHYDNSGKIIEDSSKLDPFTISKSTVSLTATSPEFDFFAFSFKRVVTLKISNVLKGSDKIGDNVRLEVFDTPFSGNPYFSGLGSMRKAQRFYLFEPVLESRNLYEYRTLELP